jgi:hypothetical protein
MKRLFACVLALALLAALSGCATTGKCTPCGQQATKSCAEAPYCPKAQALKGYEGTVHCDKCDKDLPKGKWCEKCNRFMLEGTVHCDECNKDMPRGVYCAHCKKYMGVEGVSYCAKCNSPYNTAEGCPNCKM